MTIKERMESITKLERGSSVPWEISRFFPKLSMFGSQVCFDDDGDYADLKDAQLLTLWMVEQFGLPAENVVAKLRKSSGRKALR